MFRHQGPVSKPVAEARQLSQRGLNAMERGDLASAESLLGDAVKTCPTDIDARRQYAEALWQRGQTELALQNVEKLMILAPDEPAYAERAGEMYLAVGRPDDARRIADQVLDQYPNEARAWALRARVEQNNGQLERALADYHRAMEYSRDDRELQWETAELYRRLNRPQRALSTLTSLRETYGPGEEPQSVLYVQGLALAALSRYDDAIDAFSLALERGSPTPELLCRLAEVQSAAGKQQQAEATLHKALALDPNYAPSLALRERIQLAARPLNQVFP